MNFLYYLICFTSKEKAQLGLFLSCLNYLAADAGATAEEAGLDAATFFSTTTFLAGADAAEVAATGADAAAKAVIEKAETKAIKSLFMLCPLYVNIHI